LRASDKIAILRLFHFADGDDGDNDEITQFFLCLHLCDFSLFILDWSTSLQFE
jgi:hypothetical protein